MEFLAFSLFASVIEIIRILINLYIWVIIFSALITWVNPDPNNAVVQVLRKLSAPAYRLLSRVPTQIGPVNLAPLIIIIALQFINILLGRLLIQL